MSVGRPSGIALAMGLATGSFTWSIMTVFGLSATLAADASALLAIKIFGGLYLLWLAYKSFRSATSHHDMKAKELAGGRHTPFGYLKRGYIIQMTNPKAALAWIGTFLLSIVIHLLYAVAFSTPAMVRIYGHARPVIQGVLGTFFTIAGLRLLASRS